MRTVEASVTVPAEASGWVFQQVYLQQTQAAPTHWLTDCCNIQFSYNRDQIKASNLNNVIKADWRHSAAKNNIPVLTDWLTGHLFTHELNLFCIFPQ
jgi:hypothetical protein